MKLYCILLISFLALLSSCKEKISGYTHENIVKLRFEKINYYKYPLAEESQKPYKYRLTYYFENGIPHRWIELDSIFKIQTDYIYKYDSSWIQVGAIYREDGDEMYSKEIVTFKNDTTRLTEWIDSAESVYYTMIDYLNKFGKTYRATFIGDKVHGYDSTFYNKEGFEERIFFANTKGKVLNDRSFQYDSLNEYGNWIRRKKIMDDTIRELHVREVYYDNRFTSKNNKLYEGIVSTGEWEENVINFSHNENFVFFTRTQDWINQKGYLSEKVNGLFARPKLVDGLDTIYNGAISPDGDKIIFSVRQENKEEIYLILNTGDNWIGKINITATTGIEGGYFNWLDDEELYFYTPKNNGDIVQGKMKDGVLSITDSLSAFNTVDGTEFSPYMDKKKRFLVFTRYLEGDTLQQGFFVSYNSNNYDEPKWSSPEKISSIPYGWSAFVTDELDDFIYTDGKDIYNISFDKLGLKPITK